jgi:hypothetical protein
MKNAVDVGRTAQKYGLNSGQRIFGYGVNKWEIEKA